MGMDVQSGKQQRGKSSASNEFKDNDEGIDKIDKGDSWYGCY